MKNCLFRAALAALVAFYAVPASAQITTVIGSPKRTDAAARQQAARVEQAAQDSVARVTLTGMTQWVDSAAASLALRPDTGTTSRADTALAQSPTTAPARSDSAPNVRPTDSSAALRTGARAPNTATPFPTIALLGAGMIGLGLVMRGRPRALRARARR